MMKPVLIIRFVAHEGPGYLATFLDERQVPWELIAIDQGDTLPKELFDYSGLVLMGGPMSANDPLPWVSQVIALIKQADESGLPLLGHCLGGQLISRAFDAKVTRNKVKEIGWGTVHVSDIAEAKYWFGKISQFNAFHWHGETFALPKNATHLLSSEYCQNQAYTIGKHLVLQTHVEVTPEMIKDWCDEGQEELVSANSPAVQQASDMQEDAVLHCFFLHKVAGQLYGKWVENLVN